MMTISMNNPQKIRKIGMSSLISLYLFGSLCSDMLKFTIKAFYYVFPFLFFAVLSMQFEKFPSQYSTWDQITPILLIDLISETIGYGFVLSLLLSVFWVWGKAVFGTYSELS